MIGSTTAGMRVTLPRRVTLDGRSGPNRDIKMSGDGRMVGLILTQANVHEFNRESFEAVRFGYCTKPSCRPTDRSMQYLFKRTDSDREGKIVLEAGSYLLYLIADDTRVKVDLRLHGLKGSTVLEPRGQVHSGFVMPTADNSMGSPGDNAFWYGEEIEIKGAAGYLIAILRMDLTNWADVHYGDCAYAETPPPLPLAYSPACPGGFNFFYNQQSVVPAEAEIIHPALSEIGGGGTFGYGLYYTAAAQVSDAYASFFHLSLDPEIP